MNIDYNLLAKSISFYEENDFQRIEAPWTITEEVSAITRPPGRGDFTIKEKNKVLVASGEQSFLYLSVKGFLPHGKFQAITPCFRDEKFDFTHTKYFLKNELFINNTNDITDVKEVVETAYKFFESIVPNKDLLQIVDKPNNTFDIEYKGIELGSYGSRKYKYLKWIYGTGLAEPRTSNIIK